ncbi:MAG: ArsR/SmtB family transcription factor [Desulfotomaculales bacterium]
MENERLLEAKSNLLKGLAHPKRLKILEALRDGAHCVGEIMAALAMEQTTVSQHLAVLRRFGLVSARKEGLRVMYQLRFPKVLAVLELADLILLNRARDALSILAAGDRNHQAEALVAPPAAIGPPPAAVEPGCDPEL